MHTQTDNRPRRLVQFDLPPDRLVDAETISRTAWMRRLFIRQDEMQQWAEARDEETA
jgi:hypothetical protein